MPYIILVENYDSFMNSFALKTLKVLKVYFLVWYYISWPTCTAAEVLISRPTYCLIFLLSLVPDPLDILAVLPFQGALHPVY